MKNEEINSEYSVFNCRSIGHSNDSGIKYELLLLNNYMNCGNNELMEAATVAILHLRENFNFDFINKELTVLDIGSCVGIFSIHISKLFTQINKNKNTTIYAFEPVKESYKILKTNVDLNECKNIRVLNYGISKNEDIKKMSLPDPIFLPKHVLQDDGLPGLGRYKTESKKLENWGDGVKVIEAKFKTLTNACKDNLVDFIDIIKLDCEGCENEIVESSIEQIKKTKIIYSEHHPEYDDEDVLSRNLIKLGFTAETKFMDKNGLNKLWLNTRLKEYISHEKSHRRYLGEQNKKLGPELQWTLNYEQYISSRVNDEKEKNELLHSFIVNSDNTNSYFKALPNNNWLQDLNTHRIKIKPNPHPPFASHPHYGPWFSDDGEDGILSYLFDYINRVSNFAVDIGSAHGWGGSQIRHLAHKYDWGSTEFDGGVWQCMHPRVKREWLSPKNICDLLYREGTPKEFDLLSLDLDSMDYYVLSSLLIGGYRPSVAIIEYNPIFEYHESYVVKYDPDYTKDGTSNYGASLKAFEKLMNSFNYTLIHAFAEFPELQINNCIFLKNDFIKPYFVINNISNLHPRAWVEKWKTQNSYSDVIKIKEHYISNGCMIKLD